MLDKQFLSDWVSGGYNFLNYINCNNSQMTLDIIENILNKPKFLPSIGVQYTFSRDQIKSGGMFNKQYEDCLILRNAEQTGYHTFVFSVTTMGNMSRINIYRGGFSANAKQINKRTRRMQGGVMSMVAGAMTRVDNNAMEMENFYYMTVIDIISKAFLK